MMAGVILGSPTPPIFAQPQMPDDAQAYPNEGGPGEMVMNAIHSLFTLPQRAIDASAADVQNLGDHSKPLQSVGPALEAAMLPMGTGAIAGVPVRAGEAVLGAGPIRAYHGSPHSFDAFNSANIGTGEGAQAYGHGLYFAENEGVAKSYRDALSGQLNDPAARTLVDGKPLAEHPDFMALSPTAQNRVKSAFSFSADKKSALNTLDYQLENAGGLNPRQRPDIETARKFVDGLPENMGRRSRDPGSMYETNINADPEHFLDWDKSLSEQHPKVKEVISNLDLPHGVDKDAVQRALTGNETPYDRDWNPTTGAALYRQIAKAPKQDPSQAAAALRDAGIPGIKYLDQSSRAAGEGSRNYVVFDHNLIDIARKYGLAGAIPGAGIAAPIFARSDKQ